MDRLGAVQSALTPKQSADSSRSTSRSRKLKADADARAFRETSFGTGPMNVHPRGHGGRHMGGNGSIVW